MNETDLIRSSQAGDSEAFRLLIEGHRTVLFGTAYLMAQDRGMAEDAVQEALISAWRGLPSFGFRGSLRAWLLRILVNEVKRPHRKARVQTVPLEEALAAPGNPGETEDAVLRNEERERLKAALETLPLDQRQAVVLRYYADLTVPEIGKALGCREGTVKSRLHRALNRLSGALQQTGSHPGLVRRGVMQ